MNSIKINQLTGYSLIGSFILAAVAASIQAFVDLKPFIEFLLSSGSWSMLVALPVLAFTYLFGYIFIELSNLLYEKKHRINRKEKYRQILAFLRTATSSELSEFTEVREKLELIQGASIAMLLLSIGLFLKVTQATETIGGTLEHGRLIFGFVSLAMFLCSWLLNYLTKISRRKLHLILKSVIGREEAAS